MPRVEVTIKDTMGFWNEEVGTHVFNPHGYTPVNTYVYEVPDSWVQGGELTPEGLERVFATIYGPRWRIGNADGSAYIVLEHASRVLDSSDPRPAKTIS